MSLEGKGTSYCSASKEVSSSLFVLAVSKMISCLEIMLDQRDLRKVFINPSALNGTVVIL